MRPGRGDGAAGGGGGRQRGGGGGGGRDAHGDSGPYRTQQLPACVHSLVDSSVDSFVSVSLLTPCVVIRCSRISTVQFSIQTVWLRPR